VLTIAAMGALDEFVQLLPLPPWRGIGLAGRLFCGATGLRLYVGSLESLSDPSGRLIRRLPGPHPTHFLQLFGLGHAYQAVQCVLKKCRLRVSPQVASVNSSIIVSVTRVNISCPLK
jgi:hypothetical protein